jgi:glycolate oxidase
MGLEIPDKVGCMMFLEIDGPKDSVLGQIEEIDRICGENKGLGNEWSDDPAKRAGMWAARQGLVSSLSKVKRGTRLMPLVEDFGVPINRIPDTIRAIQAIGQKYDFPMCIFGHVGDGNLHAVILLDARDKEGWEKAKRISDDLIDLTLRFEGTFTAEHGVGMAKSPYIRKELDVGAEVMQGIKSTLDPNNILNPGKMGLDDSIEDIYQQFAFQEFSEEPSRIQSFGKEVDDEILACIQCGFCRLGCPTYDETSLESLNARGRVILAYNLLTGKLEPSEEVAQRFYDCTTCLNCRSTCPAGIEVADIVEACRDRLAGKGYLPDVFKPMLESLRRHGNPFGEPAEKRTEIFPEGLKKAEGALDVLLFMGCMPSYQDIRIVPALGKIMEGIDLRYGVLGDLERCCGYIAHLIGSSRDFVALMDENLDHFSKHGSPTLVTTCAGCHRTFKELYPKYANGPVPKAVHFVEYIDQLIQEGEIRFKKSFEKKVIYHDPCDLGRHLGIYEPPRRILQAVPGLELLEFKQNRAMAKCCGGGGGMKAFDDPLSDAIAYKRADQAFEAGAEVMVSACPSCKRNLQLGASRVRKEKEGRIQVMDITEVMAKCL